MAKKSKFLTHKGSDGAVTLVRKGGDYDIGENPRLSKRASDANRGVAGASAAKLVKEFGGKDKKKLAREDKTFRKLTAERKAGMSSSGSRKRTTKDRK